MMPPESSAAQKSIPEFVLLAVLLLGSLTGCMSLEKKYELDGYKPLPPGCTPGPRDRLTRNTRRIAMKDDPKCHEHVEDYVWPYAAVPRPKLPDAPPQDHQLDLANADPETAEKYFRWLCAREAGVFISRKATNVRAVMNLRPRKHYKSYETWMLWDYFYLEDPLGLVLFRNDDADSTASLASGPLYKKTVANEFWYSFPSRLWIQEVALTPEQQLRHGGKKYVRFEPYLPAGARLVTEAGHTYVALNEGHLKEFGSMRYGFDVPNYKMRGLYTNEPMAEYGYFSREITRSAFDRALGIAGTEFFVVDLRTAEILGMVRMFGRVVTTKNGAQYRHAWFTPDMCPGHEPRGPWMNFVTFEFSVLDQDIFDPRSIEADE